MLNNTGENNMVKLIEIDTGFLSTKMEEVTETYFVNRWLKHISEFDKLIPYNKGDSDYHKSYSLYNDMIRNATELAKMEFNRIYKEQTRTKPL